MIAMQPAPQAPDSAILERWSQPHPYFTSGTDMRSSDNALLVLLYGGLEKASRYGWLNAGRTLIDKTYLRILWITQQLEPPGISFDELASRLDGFIRAELQPVWDTLAELEHEERHALAVTLVARVQAQVFQRDDQLASASVLLFFLCPQLPVFVYRQGGENADYVSWHQTCRRRLANVLPLVGHAVPSPSYGTAQEQLLISRLLNQGDWWVRRLLTQQSYPASAAPRRIAS
jgi:hypothetical protein